VNFATSQARIPVAVASLLALIAKNYAPKTGEQPEELPMRQ
jgi:hypothetical protein